jgi:hypothetical protein
VNNNVKPYQTGAAADFINDKLAAGFASFSLDELVAKTGLSVIAARNQLLRLGCLVTRVTPRQPYFLIVPPEHRGVGAPPIDWWLDDYMQWLGHPYYLALQSAAAEHGSSQQAIQETQVITDMPRREILAGLIRVRFFMKTDAHKTVVQKLPGTYAPLVVSTPESTAFDLVRYAQHIGGIERVAETITPMLPLIKVKELRRVLDAENEVTTAQRLGFIIDAIGEVHLAKEIRDWLPTKLQDIPLSIYTEGDRLAPANETWGVVNNAGCSL